MFASVLPIFVRPAEDESFMSWLERLAAAHGVGIGPLCDHIGFDWRQPLLGEVLAEDDWSLLAMATRNGRPQLASTTLCRWYKGAVETDFDAFAEPHNVGWHTVRTWASHRATRACPQCVAERRLWRIHWRLSHSGVCATHRALLVDDCPQCGFPLRGGHTDKPWPPHPTMPPDLLVCDNVHPDATPGRPRRCNHPVADITTVSVSDALAEAQQYLEDAADGREPLFLNGEPVTSAEWFEALRDVTALVNCIAGPADLGDVPEEVHSVFAEFCEQRDRMKGRGDASPSYTVPPRSAAHAAAVLSVAVPILRSPRLADGVGWLVQRAAEINRPRWRALATRLDLRSVVHDAWNANLPRHMSFALMHRVVGLFAHDFTWQPDNVTHLAPEHIYEQHFAHLLTETHPRNGRKMVQLSVVKAKENCDWPLAAVALEMDLRVAGRTIDWCTRHVTDGEAWWDEVWKYAAWLQGQPRYDYALRRELFRTLTLIPMAAWRLLCDRADVHIGRTEARRRNAAAWIWEHVCGGTFESSPALLTAEEAGARRDSLREDYRRFEKWGKTEAPLLLELLEGWAEALADLEANPATFGDAA